MKDATLCFLCRGTSPGQILLGRKKHGFGQGKYGGFGGKLEEGETAAMAAVRELAEEASLYTDVGHLDRVAHLTFRFPFKPDWDQQVQAFIVRQWQGAAVESSEMKPRWFFLDQIPYHTMWDDSVYWLPLILQGQRLTAHFTFQADNETVSGAEIISWA